MSFLPNAVTSSLAVFGVAGAVLAASPAAIASDVPGDLAGYELRGNLPGTYVRREDHVWRFEPGGKLTAVYAASQLSPRGGSNYIQGADRGTWRRDGRQFCVKFQKFYGGRELCFTATKLDGSWYRIQNTNGRVSFRASLKRR